MDGTVGTGTAGVLRRTGNQKKATSQSTPESFCATTSFMRRIRTDPDLFTASQTQKGMKTSVSRWNRKKERTGTMVTGATTQELVKGFTPGKKSGPS